MLSVKFNPFFQHATNIYKLDDYEAYLSIEYSESMYSKAIKEVKYSVKILVVQYM